MKRRTLFIIVAYITNSERQGRWKRAIMVVVWIRAIGMCTADLNRAKFDTFAGVLKEFGDGGDRSSMTTLAVTVYRKKLKKNTKQ